MINYETHNKLYYYLFLLLALVIPLYDRLVALIILAIAVNWLLEGRFRQKFMKVRRDKFRITLFSFSILYLLYCLGMIYSSNFDYGIFDLEVKLSLLIFPLIFSTLDTAVFSRERVIRLLYFYITGCVIITIIALVHSFWNYTHTNSLVEFYYSRLAAFQHPSYFSMNLNLAVAIIIVLLLREGSGFKSITKWLLILLIPYFFAIIILLSSKAGIISVLMVLVISISSIILYKKEFFIGLLFLFMLPFAFVGAFYIFPNSFYRLHEAQTAVTSGPANAKTSSEGTAERILVWKASLQVIRENLIFGVGTGDVKDFLVKKYKEDQNFGAVEQKLNSHNQYLQTFISLGLPGILALLLCLLIPFFEAIKRKNLLYFLFLFIIGFNLLVESMLERQAGVVFYAFFNSFLFFTRDNTER